MNSNDISSGSKPCKLLLVLATYALLSGALPYLRADDKRTVFHEDKLSIVLSRDWKTIERPGTLAAFASTDQTSSLFFTIAGSSNASSMDDVLTGAVDEFKKTFQVKEEGEFKWGKVKSPGDGKEWTAIFVTLELEMESLPENLPFRFYLTIFDTGSSLYLIQGSTMKPVDPNREKDILAMIRSVQAKR